MFDTPNYIIQKHINQAQKLSQGVCDQEEWPLPEPLILRENLGSCVYPVNALGPVLCRAALSIHAQVLAPLPLCANAVMAVASLLAPRHAYLILPTGQKRPIADFFMSIASTGERKSSVNEKALKAVEAYTRREKDRYGEKLKKHHKDKRIWDLEREKLEGQLKRQGDGSPSIQPTLEAHYDREPQKPPLPLLYVDNVTIEGLDKTFGQGCDNLGLFLMEGGTFLGGHSMRPENCVRTCSSVSTYWDGCMTTRLRASEEGPTTLMDKSLTMHLVIQPDIAQQFLTNKLFQSQGILTRLLCVNAPNMAGTRFKPSYTPEQKKSLQEDLHLYYSHCEWLLEKAPKTPSEMHFTPEAEAAYWRFVDTVERKQGKYKPYEPIEGLANKLPEHAARVAGMITLFNVACETQWDPHHVPPITAAAYEQAVEIAEFYAYEALRMKEEQNLSLALLEAEELWEWISHKWSGDYISVSDINGSGPRKFRNNASKIRRIFSVLMDHLCLILWGPQIIKGKKRQAAYKINRGHVKLN